MNSELPPLVLTLGDRFGVGPELVVRYLQSGKPIDRLMIVGDRRVFDDTCARLAVDPEVHPVKSSGDVEPHKTGFLDMPFDAEIGPLGKVSVEAGRESLSILDWLADALAARSISGAVYAPLNKQAMRAAGHKNGDEFDYLISKLGPEVAGGEINWLDGVWTSRVTSHIPVGEIATTITQQKIENAAELLARVMADSGISDPRIVIAALNPHAGENGAFGTEEIDKIAPAVKSLQEKGIRASGPIPADTVFPQSIHDKPVGIVTMYHDQGQIALKLLGLGKSVTMLAGLGIPIATPGHGTAYDIAGKGIARMDGMLSAIDFCTTLRT